MERISFNISFRLQGHITRSESYVVGEFTNSDQHNRNKECDYHLLIEGFIYKSQILLNVLTDG